MELCVRTDSARELAEGALSYTHIASHSHLTTEGAAEAGQRSLSLSLPLSLAFALSLSISPSLPFAFSLSRVLSLARALSLSLSLSLPLSIILSRERAFSVSPPDAFISIFIHLNLHSQ